ncbi:hypothetical protein C2845_PM15G04330 [Panicum miliaceum]|uniref:Uncharacterized protein n=1 Tax=Panicum miliaceum TaxID=4540 RepID=A0A3L6Q914_PANMI|nr:hypothetical protein C2845_PM15G04330 [Panicum miliaceum]
MLGASQTAHHISTRINKKLPKALDRRGKETSKKRQPTTKRVKSSADGNQQETPKSSPPKRPIETSKKKQPAIKWFKPPMAERC